MKKGMSIINGEIYVTGELFSPTTAELSRGVIYSGGFENSLDKDANHIRHFNDMETLSVDCISPHGYDVPSIMTQSSHGVPHKTSKRFFGESMNLKVETIFSNVDRACSQGFQIGNRALNECHTEVISSPIQIKEQCPMCSNSLTTQVFRREDGCTQNVQLCPLPPFCSYCRAYNVFEQPVMDDKNSLENLIDLMTDASQTRFRKGKIIFHKTFEKCLSGMAHEDGKIISQRFPHVKVKNNSNLFTNKEEYSSNEFRHGSVEKDGIIPIKKEKETAEQNATNYPYEHESDHLILSDYIQNLQNKSRKLRDSKKAKRCFSSTNEIYQDSHRLKCSNECEVKSPILEYITLHRTMKTVISSESSLTSSPILNKIEGTSMTGKKDEEESLEQSNWNHIFESHPSKLSLTESHPSKLSLTDEEFNREIFGQQPCLEDDFLFGEDEDSDETSMNSDRKELLMRKEIFAMRDIATDVIGNGFRSGYRLTQIQCKFCMMPVMEKHGTLSCLTCPKVADKVKNLSRWTLINPANEKVNSNILSVRETVHDAIVPELSNSTRDKVDTSVTARKLQERIPKDCAKEPTYKNRANTLRLCKTSASSTTISSGTRTDASYSNIRPIFQSDIPNNSVNGINTPSIWSSHSDKENLAQGQCRTRRKKPSPESPDCHRPMPKQVIKKKTKTEDINNLLNSTLHVTKKITNSIITHDSSAKLRSPKNCYRSYDGGTKDLLCPYSWKTPEKKQEVKEKGHFCVKPKEVERTQQTKPLDMQIIQHSGETYETETMYSSIDDGDSVCSRARNTNLSIDGENIHYFSNSTDTQSLHETPTDLQSVTSGESLAKAENHNSSFCPDAKYEHMLHLKSPKDVNNEGSDTGTTEALSIYTLNYNMMQSSYSDEDSLIVHDKSRNNGPSKENIFDKKNEVITPEEDRMRAKSSGLLTHNSNHFTTNDSIICSEKENDDVESGLMNSSNRSDTTIDHEVSDKDLLGYNSLQQRDMKRQRHTTTCLQGRRTHEHDIDAVKKWQEQDVDEEAMTILLKKLESTAEAINDVGKWIEFEEVQAMDNLDQMERERERQ